jgi:hypothetical protein
MEGSDKYARVGDWLWLLALGIASSVWCWTAAGQLGATFDEPIYVARGLTSWRTGSHQGLMQLGTMPLPVDLDTLPLYLWERWQGTPLDPTDDLSRLLPWARTGTLVFWWLLLMYGRLAGRQLAGPWGGRLAVALLACEPCLLAHASLATTDIAITACLLALVYHFRTGREAGWGRRVGWPAFWFAAAVLAKASGLVFGPLCLLVVEVERLYARAKAAATPTDQPWRFTLMGLVSAFRLLLRDGCQILTLGLVLTFLYCGCDWRVEPSFVSWAQQLPDGPARRAMVWFAEHLRIFSNAGEGLVRQIKHNVRGHGTYLLGKVADRAIWYYFPVALSIKLSLPLLLLPVALAILRPRSLYNWACLAAVVLLAFSLTCRVQIGIRLVLPLVALAAVGLGAAAAHAIHKGPSTLLSRAHALTLLVTAGLLWTAAAAVRVWPEGLCYTNELWGGTEKGYLVLSDSNYDWGQGLKELERWRQQHADADLDIWYFGTDPALHQLPMRELPFHLLVLDSPADAQARVRGHYLAVSTTILYGSVSTTLAPGSPLARSCGHTLALLRSRRPVDRTATFLIYDFTEHGGHTSRTTPLALTRGPASPRPPAGW